MPFFSFYDSGSFHLMSSKFVHIITYYKINSSWRLNNLPLYACIQPYPYSSLDRHVGCLHILFVMNNDVEVQRSLWESWFEFFWIYIPRNGIARSSSVFTFWGTSPCHLCCYYYPVARACPTLWGPMDMWSLEYPKEHGETSGQRLEENAAHPGIVVMWRREESGQRLGIPRASCASSVTGSLFSDKTVQSFMTAPILCTDLES